MREVKNMDITLKCHCFQTSCGAYLASYPMNNRGSFPRGKVAGV